MTDTAEQFLPTVETWYDAVVIRMNGLVHAHIKLSEYLGFQSWFDGPHNYKLEFQMKGGAIQLHYDTIEKWKAVLEGLERAFIIEKFRGQK